MILDRADLMNFAQRYAPSRACERAIREGRAYILGGFKPTEGFPCWVLKAWSDRGKVWYLKVVCDTNSRTYGMRVIPEDDPIFQAPQVLLDRRFRNG